MECWFELFYGVDGQTLLSAFTAIDGGADLPSTVVIAEAHWSYIFFSYTDDGDPNPKFSINTVGSAYEIRIDDDLETPIDQAMALYEALVAFRDGTFTSAWLRDQLMLMISTPDMTPSEEQALWNAYWEGLQASYNNAVASASLLADLYVNGLTILNEPVNVVIDINDAANGDLWAAAAVALPIIPDEWLERGGKIILKHGGNVVQVFQKSDKHIPAWAYKYAEMVKNNEWVDWSQIPDAPDDLQPKIRKFAREAGFLELPPYVNKAKRWVDFSDWAFDIPGHGKTVTLPKTWTDSATGTIYRGIWSHRNDAHHKMILEKMYFPSGGFPPGYGDNPSKWKWHHHHESGKMQLVQAGIHTATSHNGGRKTWACCRR